MLMKVTLDDLAPFKKICSRICLNIPDTYYWQWDKIREMAFLALEKEDAELVFFPLFKEFNHHWDFASNGDSDTVVAPRINSEFGLMPGQAFFSSRPICDLILFVAWWPWGQDDKISMRVGLIPASNKRLRQGVAFQCLSRWLDITS
jgi:hypothetical protein